MSPELFQQLQAVFLTECEDGLATAEGLLLQLQEDPSHMDAVHGVFRAIHSIKGGAPAAGLPGVVELAHHAESYLEKVRSRALALHADAVGVLLEVVDGLRSCIEREAQGQPIDPVHVRNLLAQLEALQPGAADETPAAHAGASRYRIEFRPHPEVMASGNDPLKVLEELERLTPFTAELLVEGLPSLSELSVDEVHVSWRLKTHREVELEALKEIFAWIDLDCDLDFEPIPPEVESTRPESEPSPPSGSPAGSQVPSLRVEADKIDRLMNLVGELVINQAMLTQLSQQEDAESRRRLSEGLEELQRNTRDLQESVLHIRMVPVRFLFARYPRMVRDLQQTLNKRVRLVLAGEATELDKTLIEHMADPLTHLVRNSLDHGLEDETTRIQAGKDPVGTLRLEAIHRGDKIVIEVSDDGRGIDPERIKARAVERGLVTLDAELSAEEAHDLLFQPGFSTAAEVTDISGRGVGLDVVRRNLHALGASIQVRSELGRGTTFSLELPLTLAIVDAQLVQVGTQRFVLPLSSIHESVQVRPQEVHAIADGGLQLLKLRDAHLPILHLSEFFGVGPRSEPKLVVVVETEGQRMALVVDDFLGQQQVVVKSLEDNYGHIPGVAGATILGDGRVALILETSELLKGASAGKELEHV